MSPIVRRELFDTLRRPRTLAVQVVFAAVLSLLVIAVWPQQAQVNLGGRQARELLAVFVYGLLILLVLVPPAFAATSIVRERQRGTLTLLLTSPMTPLQIMAGKLLAAVGFIALLLVLSLPAASACYVMGGVSWKSLLGSYGILALAAVQAAMLSLAVSAVARSVDSSLRYAYGLVFVVMVLAMVPWFLVRGQGLGPIEVAATWLASLGPFPAVMHGLGHGAVGGRGMAEASDPLGRYVLLALISIGVCAWILHRRLAPHAVDRPRPKGQVTDEQSRGVRVFRRLMFLVDPNRRSGHIADYENPVMMKEFRSRRFGRASWMIRIIGLCLLVSLGLMLVTLAGAVSLGLGYTGGLLVIFQMGLILLIAPALSAGLISAERESGGWTLLRMTPLSPWSVVLGKLLSVGWTLLLLLLATLPGYGIMLLIDPGESGHVTEVLITLGLTAVFAMLLGAAASSCFGRTANATAAAYLVLLGLCVLTFLPWLAEGSLFGVDLVRRILMFNPVAAALSSVRMPALANTVPAAGTWA
ncbi:MAG: ABC transporter permease, partial [Phycisphaerae bacterium]|nr:ABC transporter permease [Phycisphaerae bacterium]